MRRRLTLAIVSVVAGALLLAGLGTLLVVDRANNAAVHRSLVSQAKALLNIGVWHGYAKHNDCLENIKLALKQLLTQ